MGYVSLTHPQPQGDPNLPHPRTVLSAWNGFSLCSASTQRQSERDQLSSKSCSAEESCSRNTLPVWLIYHPGRTNLPWKHLLLCPSQRAGRDSSDWTWLPTGGNTDFWVSPLLVAETAHYSQQSLRGNSAQPEVDALGWMTKLHWPLPHPPFSCRAGLVGSVVLGSSPLPHRSF